MLAFVGGFAASVVAVNHLHVGLDQKLSMPTVHVYSCLSVV